jgi:O-antigen/teichoic acid export membrane protein
LDLAAMKQSQRIAKNLLAGGIALAGGGVIQLVAVVLIARYLTVSDFGAYSFIVALVLFFQQLFDSGLSNILMRDLAVRPHRMKEILGAALVLVWLFALAAALPLMAIVMLLHLSHQLKVLIALMAVSMVAELHNSCYGAALRSQEDNELHTAGFLLHKMFFLALVVFGIKADLGLSGVVAAYVLSAVALWALFRRLVVRRYAPARLNFNRRRLRYLVRSSLPLGMGITARLMAQQADILILTLLTDLRTVGLFSGPYRITTNLRLIPQNLSIPLYPLYSRLATSPQAAAQFQSACDLSIKVFLLAAFPFATAFLISSDIVITSLLGARYQSAAPAMQLLGLAFIPLFVASPLVLLLTALRQERFLFTSSAWSLALRVALDFCLIPIVGFAGPCIALLASETAVVTWWVMRLGRMGFPLRVGALVWRPLLASLCVGLIIGYLRPHSGVVLGAAWLGAGVLYLGIVVKLGAITNADRELLREGRGFLGPFLAQWSADEANNLASP